MEFTIKNIEALTEAQATEMALEVITIKAHSVYFVDFGGYFGYSALVFADGHHIKYANDYQLHHGRLNREELRHWYIDSMSKKLFTDAELDTVTDYKDETAKREYLRNYYGLRRDHISAFFIGSDAEREKLQKKTDAMIFSSVFLAYYDKKDADFVRHGAELWRRLKKSINREKSNADYWRSAFLSEMCNHEYCINNQADFDVCSCFGNCSDVAAYEDVNALFDACGFSDIQRAAYMDARHEYYKNASY